MAVVTFCSFQKFQRNRFFFFTFSAISKVRCQSDRVVEFQDKRMTSWTWTQITARPRDTRILVPEKNRAAQNRTS